MLRITIAKRLWFGSAITIYETVRLELMKISIFAPEIKL